MKWSAAGLVGAASAALAGLVGAWAAGGLTPAISATAMMIGLGSAVLAWRQTPPETQRPSVVDWMLLGIFAAASARVFFWLLLPVGDSWQIQCPNNLGDLALHWQMIRYFAAGAAWWPESPIFPGVPLRYPPGTNLLNAMLLQLGVPLAQGLVWVGLISSALTAALLWRWGRAFALAAFLFAGGAAGFIFWSSGWPPGPTDGVEWKNLFLTLFVTQRGLLLALPIGLLLLSQWRARLREVSLPFPRWVEVFLYASLPFFHLHSFLFLSLVLGLAWLTTCRSKAGNDFLVTGVWAFVPATVLVWLVTGGGPFAGASGMIGWQPGWLQGARGWEFWWLNFGLSLPLAILAGLRMFFWPSSQRQTPNLRSDRVIFTAAAVTWGACLLVRFAPWAWDNTKLMIWAWLAAAPIVYAWTLAILQPWWRIPLLLGLFFSGALSLADGLASRHSYGLASRSELAQAAAVLQGIPPSTRLLAAPHFAQPAALLGYPVLLGYDGHLWSHGYNYTPLLQELRRLFGGQTTNASLGGYRYFLVGPLEKQQFGQLNLSANWRKIRSQGNFSLWELTQ